jgi:hypothetical protein
MGDYRQSTPPLESRDSILGQIPVLSSSITTGDVTMHSTLSPVHRAFETTELLENILTHLLYAHNTFLLVLCRRVSRLFRNNVDHSLRLQRDWFLKSNGCRCPSMDGGHEISLEIHRGRMHCRNDIHPLLFPAECNPKSDFAAYFSLYNIVQVGYFANSRATFNLNRFTQTFENVSGLCDDSLIHKMYLTNPPIKVVEIWMSVDLVNPTVEDYPRETFEESEERKKHAKYPQRFLGGDDILTSDEGITFGQLFEYTKEKVAGLKKEDVLPYQAPPFPVGDWSACWDTVSKCLNSYANSYASDCEEDWGTESEE